jgi:hypothetical protein
MERRRIDELHRERDMLSKMRAQADNATTRQSDLVKVGLHPLAPPPTGAPSWQLAARLAGCRRQPAGRPAVPATAPCTMARVQPPVR